ncbi:MAG: phosphate ABC transporter permease PstA [Promethearchaeota archaeon]
MTIEENSGEALYMKEKLEKKSIRYLLFFCALLAIVIVFFIILFLFISGGPFFQEIPLLEFLFGDMWDPTNAENPQFGAFNLIIGTLLVTLGAMIISIPLGIATAIFIAEIAPERIARFMKGAVELLSGIPSVIFGFFGLVVLNVWLMETFDLDTGNTWLSGSIILAIMSLPTIVSVSEDAISSVPKEFKEGALAMGATKWQTIRGVIIQAALPGITAAIILGIGRAIGETMAVMMITGNTALLPEPITNIFAPIRTITATIGIEMGEVPTGSLHFQALFALAIVLFIITLIINTIANLILSRLKTRFHETKTEKKTRICLPENLRNFFKRYKKPILCLFLFTSFNWVIYTWFGWFTVIIICLISGGIFFFIKKISAKNIQNIIFGGISAATFIVLFALFLIIYFIIIRGLPAITWEFLTESPRDLGREGGIFPALIGTLLLVAGAILYAVPIGILAAIYLAEYAKDGKFTKLIRASIEALNGTPSIVFGLFGFAVFVLYFGLGISMVAGQLTLALMILPTIIRITEESINAIPQSFREGSLALGSTKWQSIKKVVLPAAMPGIITGIIIGMGRVAGETAPILFTAVIFQQRFIPLFPIQPVMSLTYHLFILATGVPDSEAQAYGTALVLLVIVLFFYVIAMFVRKYYQKKMKW